MKQKYIDNVIYDVDDKIDQIFVYHNIPDDEKTKLVKKHITKMMKEFEKLMEYWGDVE